MNIVFASEHSSETMSAFSGVPFFMSHALEAAVDSFEYIQTPGYNFDVIRYDYEKGLEQLKRAGQYLSDRLKATKADVIICQGSSMIPFLETDTPVVLWHDATWLGLMGMSLEDFKKHYPLLHEWDQRALERCDVIGLAADWVCRQTIESYGMPEEKVITLPFGANFTEIPPDAMERLLESRPRNFCQLTFLGVDWGRKGLPLAYEVSKALNKRGLRTGLNVMGCDVPRLGWRRRLQHYTGLERFTSLEQFRSQILRDRHVVHMGFLNKDDPLHYTAMLEVIAKSHFLLHPASFEAFGIALVEANALSVPVVAIDHYGPQTIIRNGVNGQLFSTEEYVEGAVSFIMQQMQDYENYLSLARSARIEQQQRLAWDRSVEKLIQKLQGVTETS